VNWYKSAQVDYQKKIKKLEKDLRSQYPGLDLALWVSNGYVELAVLEVPKEMQNRGIGHKVVNEIKSFARKMGFPVVLRPSANHGKKKALERFYKDLEFVPNKGRNIDYQLSSPFGSTMYWKPHPLKFENMHMDHHNEQDDYILVARDNSQPVGAIEYSVFNDQVYINMIRVVPNRRRQGIASRLYKKLEEYNSGLQINWGNSTNEGHDLYKSIFGENRNSATNDAVSR